MRLEEAKIRYPNEWIAFRADSEEENPEGEVILHHPDRKTFDRKLMSKRITNLYLTFTGQLVKEGYSILFLLG